MNMHLLTHIETPNDLRKINKSELPQLAQELRDFIIDVVSVKEGHLGASLGVVELTIALNCVLERLNIEDRQIREDLDNLLKEINLKPGNNAIHQNFEKLEKLNLFLS